MPLFVHDPFYNAVFNAVAPRAQPACDTGCKTSPNSQQQQQQQRKKPLPSLPIDWSVWEDGQAYHIAADLPGAQRDSLSVNVHDSVLELSAKRDLLGIEQQQEQEKQQQEKQQQEEDAEDKQKQDDWAAEDGEYEEVTVEQPPQSDTESVKSAGSQASSKTPVELHMPRRWHFVERPVFGVFRRKLQLPDDADIDAIHAEYNDGVLRLRINKRPEQHRSIPIAFT